MFAHEACGLGFRSRFKLFKIDVAGLGVSGLGFRSLGFRSRFVLFKIDVAGLGVAGLEFRSLGFRAYSCIVRKCLFVQRSEQGLGFRA